MAPRTRKHRTRRSTKRRTRTRKIRGGGGVTWRNTPIDPTNPNIHNTLTNVREVEPYIKAAATHKRRNNEGTYGTWAGHEYLTDKYGRVIRDDRGYYVHRTALNSPPSNLDQASIPTYSLGERPAPAKPTLKQYAPHESFNHVEDVLDLEHKEPEGTVLQRIQNARRLNPPLKAIMMPGVRRVNAKRIGNEYAEEESKYSNRE